MRDVEVSFPKPCSEQWESMAPSGCNRLCARCDTVVHDLSVLTFDEAQALVRREPDACVRATINARGEVALKSSGVSVRQMVIALGASVGLFAGGAPVAAAERHDRASIAGTLTTSDWNTRVTATSAEGKSYRTRVKQSGKYRLKRLPPGTYSLTFVPSCGDPWSVDAIKVADNQPLTLDATDPNPCIVVGAIRIETDAG